MQLVMRLRLLLSVVVEVKPGLGSKLRRALGRGWCWSVYQAVDGVHGCRTADRRGRSNSHYWRGAGPEAKSAMQGEAR